MYKITAISITGNVLATITLKTKKFSLITKFQQKIGSKYGALPSIKIEEIK